ncbi:Uncharacterised protein [Yersinia similis]|uniref:Uncharacterized protein n=1 Tax=Yersinia similis TaxID=367190 RepID=A0A0T9QHH6_9GAMM|nr:Uncharacterised protein [Yersinia similis]CNB50584.1 Uncharacterised protein [Yersinia similis]CNE42498.1 Uncharacterised protein [Yersinia similis]CNF54290.1 Uncharacterised protein [Yersinia similis]CNI11300.1 Uncharacterised protein [Yersinia similis]
MVSLLVGLALMAASVSIIVTPAIALSLFNCVTLDLD